MIDLINVYYFHFAEFI